MNTQPAVLLYNFNDPDRLRIIRRYLNRQKVKVRIVTTPEFLHPLGYLFELPGFQPCAQFNLGKNFSEEMMVLNNFSSRGQGLSEQLQRAAGLSRRAGEAQWH